MEKLKPMEISSTNQSRNQISENTSPAYSMKGKGSIIVLVSASFVVFFILISMTKSMSTNLSIVEVERPVDLLSKIQTTTTIAQKLNKLCTLSVSTPEIITQDKINV
jgi:hypothetical protein